MLKRSAIVGVLGAFLLVAMATDAKADRIKELLAYAGGAGAENIVSDDSYEYLVERATATSSVNGVLEVGESIRGIIKFTTIENVNGNVTIGAGGHSEWSAVFQTLVVGKDDGGTPADGKFNFAFGPDPAFAEAIGLGLGGSAMVLMYEDTTPDFSITGGPASVDETNATNGIFFWALGMNGTFIAGADGTLFTGDDITTLDEGWHAVDTLDSVPTTAETSIGSADIWLNRILGASGIGDTLILGSYASAFGSGGPIQFKGDALFQTPPGFSKWPIGNQAELRFNVLVPLPAAAWAGLGLLGLLGVGRRMRRRS